MVRPALFYQISRKTMKLEYYATGTMQSDREPKPTRYIP